MKSITYPSIFHFLFRSMILLLPWAPRPTNAQQIPNRTNLIMYELEQFLVDIDGPNEHAFERPILPCESYAVGGGNLLENQYGLQSAAQWIRTAWHDFNTANVYNGTGGLDASIGFEASRATNKGPMVPDSMYFFGFFASDICSMADLVALGLVIAVGACGGPYVPLRGGRIDATGPGPVDVAFDPETPLNTTLQGFAQAGFTQEEAITLTACGHTMGGVHANIFPEVVNTDIMSPANVEGRQNFDDTVATHDNHRLREYVTNTGGRGGPMAASPNRTVNADYRLFSSDGNSTVRKLAANQTYFESQCAKVMAKMIDTVPAGVELTPVIEPFLYKPINISLDVDWNGNMTIAGFIRYLARNEVDAAPPTLEVFHVGLDLEPSTFVVGTTNSSLTGTTIFGPTTFYAFSIPFSSSTGLSGLKVQGVNLPFQDSMFVVPSLSSISPSFSELSVIFPETYTINLTTALRVEPGTKPPPFLTATFAIPVLLNGAVGNRGIDKSLSANLPFIGNAGPFALYSTVTKLHNITDSPQLIRSSVDIVGQNVSAQVMFFGLFGLLVGH